MQVLPVADILDCRHLVPKHPPGAKHLVSGYLSGQPSQAKTGLSALDLKRQLGVSYPTAWLIQQKLMQAMVERDAQYTLSGDVHVDDAYLGGELAGGKAGRGSENKVPFVAAISLSAEGRPLYIKMAPVPGFTRKALLAGLTKTFHQIV